MANGSMTKLYRVDESTGKKIVRGYKVEWRDGSGRQAAKRSKTFDAKHKAAADRLLQQVRLTSAVSGTPLAAGGRVSVGVFFEKVYLPRTRTKANATFATMMSNWTKWIEPEIGAKRMSDVTIEDIEKLLSKIAGEGLTETPVKVRQLLRKMWALALKRDFVRRDVAREAEILWPEPLFEADQEQQIDASYQVLSVEEVKAIAEGIDPHFRTLVLFIAATGLRVGEVAALRVRDFDNAAKTIRVTKSVSSATSSRRHGSASGTKKPKTKNSIRTIDLSAKIVELLVEQVAGRAQDALLFTSVSGHRFNPKNFARRDWSRARINANIPAHYTPHDLRHFAASQLLAVLPPENVYKYLGHASPQVTMSIYAHLIPERSQAVKEAVEQVPVI
jgi:integrase